jgi:hypothetical protein
VVAVQRRSVTPIDMNIVIIVIITTSSQHAYVSALDPTQEVPEGTKSQKCYGMDAQNSNLTQHNKTRHSDFLHSPQKHNRLSTVRSDVKYFKCSEIRLLLKDSVPQ